MDAKPELATTLVCGASTLAAATRRQWHVNGCSSPLDAGLAAAALVPSLDSRLAACAHQHAFARGTGPHIWVRLCFDLLWGCERGESIARCAPRLQSSFFWRPRFRRFCPRFRKEELIAQADLEEVSSDARRATGAAIDVQPDSQNAIVRTNLGLRAWLRRVWHHAADQARPLCLDGVGLGLHLWRRRVTRSHEISAAPGSACLHSSRTLFPTLCAAQLQSRCGAANRGDEHVQRDGQPLDALRRSARGDDGQ